MYHLSEHQINFILDDIRARGVEMESLQQDLHDHICCIIENQLEANGDFMQFYDTVIKSFYKKELREIEEETISLLTNKNYYAMKKIMMISGTASAIVLSMGILLKFMHYPGAGALIASGILLFSFLFLPLMFTLKIKEKKQTKDKILLGLGSAVGILISLGILFKIMHWPFANIMGVTAVGILILLYLPINLVTGIRNPDTKVNTIVSSILLVAGCGLFLSLARSPQGSKSFYIKNTAYFVRNNELVRNEMQQIEELAASKNIVINESMKSRQIITVCEDLKSMLIWAETGNASIDGNFESKQAWIGETLSEVYFDPASKTYQKYQELLSLVQKYNEDHFGQPGFQPLPSTSVITLENNEKVLDVLNNLIQLELYLLQNEEKNLL